MELQKSLPAVVVRGTIPMPNNDFRIEVGRKLSLKAVEQSEQAFDQYVIILIQKNPLIENPTQEDIEPIGVLAKVSMKIKLPNDAYKIKFNILERVKIKDYFLSEPYFVVDYEMLETIKDNIDEEITLVKMVVSELTQHHQTILQPQSNVLEKVQQGIETDKLVDLVVLNLKSNEQSKYQYLEERHLNKRLKLLLEDIAKQKMIVDLEQKINDEIKRSIDENQKEYYLREKLRAMQNELGDKAKR